MSEANSSPVVQGGTEPPLAEASVIPMAILDAYRNRLDSEFAQADEAFWNAEEEDDTSDETVFLNGRRGAICDAKIWLAECIRKADSGEARTPNA